MRKIPDRLWGSGIPPDGTLLWLCPKFRVTEVAPPDEWGLLPVAELCRPELFGLCKNLKGRTTLRLTEL